MLQTKGKGRLILKVREECVSTMNAMRETCVRELSQLRCQMNECMRKKSVRERGRNVCKQKVRLTLKVREKCVSTMSA